MMRSGRLYELPMPERPTVENDSSSSDGWRTPRAAEAAHSGRTAKPKPGQTLGLVEQVHTLWPTPAAGNFNDSEDPQSFLARQERLKAEGKNGNGCGTPLAMAVRLDWPTPTGQDSAASGAAAYSTASGRHSGTTLTDAAVRGLWATPRKEGFDAGRHRGQADSLHSQIKQWANQTTRDWKDGDGTADVPTNALLGRQVPRDLTTAESGKLNPDWVESLMGFPLGWTAGLPVPAKSSTRGKRRESAASATTEPRD